MIEKGDFSDNLNSNDLGAEESEGGFSILEKEDDYYKHMEKLEKTPSWPTPE